MKTQLDTLLIQLEGTVPLSPEWRGVEDEFMEVLVSEEERIQEIYQIKYEQVGCEQQ
jgi:hypothetical protein